MKFFPPTWMRTAIQGIFLATHATAFSADVFAQAAKGAESQQSLKQLIEAARKEGRVDWYALNSLRSQGARAVGQAFNKRFGLNLQVNADMSGRTVEKLSDEIIKSKTGLPPSYDVMYGPDDRIVRLWQNGGMERVDRWDVLLKEISAEGYAVKDKISPLDLAGYAFLSGTRIKAINYNTSAIAEADLPQTRADLGNPKFHGTYVLEPFTTTTEFGVLVYPRDRWLEIVRSWGSWTPPLISNQAAVDRMLLGEFKFCPGKRASCVSDQGEKSEGADCAGILQRSHTAILRLSRSAKRRETPECC